jgi:hypothetical protein
MAIRVSVSPIRPGPDGADGRVDGSVSLPGGKADRVQVNDILALDKPL